jgi:transcription antitermination factor NusG
MRRWYVCRSVKKGETDAAAELVAVGFDAFCPMERKLEKDRLSKKWKVVARPLLTGYLFVELDLGEPGWGEAAHVDSVSYLLPRGSLTPTPVPEGLVEAIRASDIASSRVTLGEMLGQARRRQERARLAANAIVRVTSGPFAGYEGLVKADEGRAILKLIIGGLETSIPATQVEAA